MKMREIYVMAAQHFASAGEFRPSHCDVRCTVNDIMESLSRDGYGVNAYYSQDMAFRTVRRLLGSPCAALD